VSAVGDRGWGGSGRGDRRCCRAPAASWISALALATSLALLVGLPVGGCARSPQVARPPAPPAPPPREDLFVVLPAADGKVGAITVTHGAQQRVLDTAYGAARIPEKGRLETGRASEQEVREVFGTALDARPLAPTSFTLFFTFGTDELTPDSQRALARVSAEIARRPAAEVVVIGHTDRVGTVERNDALSLQRAERVRGDLAKIGIAADRIQTAGRGEREPLVPTEDEVAEPRNRRVEITVR
jgi:outer membrane protein OmpA-like peptidoglycan-associated protein